VKTCAKCTERSDQHRARYAKRCTANKENGEDHTDQELVDERGEDISIFTERMPTLAYKHVLEVVSRHKDHAFKLDCMAQLTEAEVEEMELEGDMSVLSRAHAVARAIRNACGWRFK
jgi:hypothetical protein